MTMIFVKPAEGRRVVMPPTLGKTRGVALADAGQLVELTSFVQRRISQGDLVVVEAKKMEAKATERPAPVTAADKPAKEA